MFGDRVERVRARMGEVGVEVVLLSPGAELAWLTGYNVKASERLTMLVLRPESDAVLLVPELEAPKVEPRPDLFEVRPWGETDDPLQTVARLVGGGLAVAISDRTWARFVLALQEALPDASWQTASTVIAPLRALKDEAEIAALRRAAHAADDVAAQLMGGDIGLTGRTEADVSAEIGARLRAAGHDSVSFAIVASGPNSASPHHTPGSRVIGAGDPVMCDFGGPLAGYCSDITRTVVAGEPTARLQEVYGVVHEAHACAVETARVGVAAEDVDRAARQVIVEAGFGAHFIHRTGHGIGLEGHEDPYLVAGNHIPLEAGNAFSIEPGIYLPGEFGVRIEDIVIATDGGPDVLNQADHSLTVVEG